ncbi:MAG TPA: MarR family transcriptional regulator [Geomonas sp.]|nr:MarR family transcriptional regulator [Geomonas sp.]
MSKTRQQIPNKNLLFRLAALTRRWRQVLDAEFQSSGLTDATWRPLLHLHHMGDGVRQKDLAASLGLEGPSLVRLLDTLIAKQLVLRTEDESDRRAKLLALTGQGRALVEVIQKRVGALEKEAFKSFSVAELAQMADFVDRLEPAVNEVRSRLRLKESR